MANPTYTVSMDIVTAGVIPAADVLRVGIDRILSDSFTQLGIGRASVLLDNSGGDYSPELNANARPYRSVVIGAVTDAGSKYLLFTGTVDAISANPRLGNRRVLVQCSDRAGRLSKKIETSFRLNTKISSLAVDVLSAAGLAASEYSVDKIQDSVSFGWLNDISGGAAIHQLVQSGAHFALVGGDGVLRVRERNADLEDTIVSSYVSNFLQLDYEMNVGRIVNDARISGQSRRVASVVNTVAWLEESLRIAGSATQTFFLEYLDPDTNEAPTPVSSPVTPVASTDYLFTANEDGTGTDLTSQTNLTFTPFATNAKIVVENAGAGAGFLSKFQIRGFAVQRQPKITLRSEINSSQTTYDRRTFEITSDLIDSAPFAENYAQFLTANWHDPLGRVSFALRNVFPDVLALDLFNRVHAVESHSGIGGDWRVAEISHDVDMSVGLEHTTIYGLNVAQAKDYLILDHATDGKLDIRELGF
jgi:hypothetical protein